jgi:hypothetical protein
LPISSPAALPELQVTQVRRIRWHYEKANAWHDFSEDLQNSIEEGYQNQLTNNGTELKVFKYKSKESVYLLDFDTMIRTNVTNERHNQRRIQRLPAYNGENMV